MSASQHGCPTRLGIGGAPGAGLLRTTSRIGRDLAHSPSKSLSLLLRNPIQECGVDGLQLMCNLRKHGSRIVRRRQAHHAPVTREALPLQEAEPYEPVHIPADGGGVDWDDLSQCRGCSTPAAGTLVKDGPLYRHDLVRRERLAGQLGIGRHHTGGYQSQRPYGILLSCHRRTPFTSACRGASLLHTRCAIIELIAVTSIAKALGQVVHSCPRGVGSASIQTAAGWNPAHECG